MNIFFKKKSTQLKWHEKFPNMTQFITNQGTVVCGWPKGQEDRAGIFVEENRTALH
jgi:hypothetical protein